MASKLTPLPSLTLRTMRPLAVDRAVAAGQVELDADGARQVLAVQQHAAGADVDGLHGLLRAGLAAVLGQRRDEDRQRAVEAHEAAQLARRHGVVDAKARADVVAAQQRAREHDDLAVVLEAHLGLGRQRAGSRGHPAGHREGGLGPAHVHDSRGESRVAHVKVHGLEVCGTGCHHTRSSVVDSDG